MSYTLTFMEFSKSWDIWTAWDNSDEKIFDKWLENKGCIVIFDKFSNITHIEFPSEQHFLSFKLKHS